MHRRTAWVPDQQGRRSEELRVGHLVGRRIVGGRYFEIPYPDGLPSYDAAGFHTLDFGLEMDLDDGAVWSFISQQAGPDEGLLAFRGTLRGTALDPAGEYAVWPVEELALWQPLIGAVVADVRSAWAVFDRNLCPITWTLSTHGGAWLAVTMGSRDNDGRFIPMHDEVALFFDRESAQVAGVELPSGED